MVGNTNEKDIFIILWTGNKPNCCPWRFLDEDDVEIMINFKGGIDNDVVFSDILQKDLEVF